jgi:acetyl esterase/lipase
MVIQGGAFKSQDGQGFRPFAEHLAREGLGAALVAYRGRPGHTYLDTMADIKAAVRFVRKISGDHGIAPERIGAMGRSAGATLALLLAVSGDVEEFEGHGGNAGFSSLIQAAVGIAGVYDFTARFTEEEQISVQPELDTKIKSNSEWIGAPFSPEDEHWLRASAVNHVSSETPPILLMHSKDDRVVPWMQSRDMHTTLREAGIPSRIQLSDTGRHAGPPNARERMVAFFRKVLVVHST